MNDFIKYVEGLRSKLGIKTDTVLALNIGKTQSYTSKMMKGMQPPSDDVCIKLATLSGDSPETIIALAHKCYAPDSEKPYWNRIFEAVSKCHLKEAALSFLFISYLFYSAVPFDILC